MQQVCATASLFVDKHKNDSLSFEKMFYATSLFYTPSIEDEEDIEITIKTTCFPDVTELKTRAYLPKGKFCRIIPKSDSYIAIFAKNDATDIRVFPHPEENAEYFCKTNLSEFEKSGWPETVLTLAKGQILVTRAGMPFYLDTGNKVIIKEIKTAVVVPAPITSDYTLEQIQKHIDSLETGLWEYDDRHVKAHMETLSKPGSKDAKKAYNLLYKRIKDAQSEETLEQLSHVKADLEKISQLLEASESKTFNKRSAKSLESARTKYDDIVNDKKTYLLGGTAKTIQKIRATVEKLVMMMDEEDEEEDGSDDGGEEKLMMKFGDELRQIIRDGNAISKTNNKYKNKIEKEYLLVLEQCKNNPNGEIDVTRLAKYIKKASAKKPKAATTCKCADNQKCILDTEYCKDCLVEKIDERIETIEEKNFPSLRASNKKTNGSFDCRLNKLDDMHENLTKYYEEFIERKTKAGLAKLESELKKMEEYFTQTFDRKNDDDEENNGSTKRTRDEEDDEEDEDDVHDVIMRTSEEEDDDEEEYDDDDEESFKSKSKKSCTDLAHRVMLTLNRVPVKSVQDLLISDYASETKRPGIEYTLKDLDAVTEIFGIELTKKDDDYPTPYHTCFRTHTEAATVANSLKIKGMVEAKVVTKKI